MSEHFIACVAGLIGSGKTTLCNRIISEYSFEHRNIGDELANVFRREHDLPPEAAVSGLQRMITHQALGRDNPSYIPEFMMGGSYNMRLIDGLRNYSHALKFVKAGGYVISLVAPRPFRLMHKINHPEPGKDPNFEALIRREITELDNPDPDSSQALRVMALALEHGCFIDASQSEEQVFEDAIRYLSQVTTLT